MTVATVANAQTKEEGYKFTDIKRLPTTSVKSQDRAGTCWSWSTISFLESEIMRMGKDSVSLAPLYVVWNTYHQKADKYVRMQGKMNFGQGGASADVTWAIKEHGIVPLELYTGLNYGENVHAHGELDAVLKGYVDAIVSNPNKKLSTAWLRGYDAVLNEYLGAKPEKFTWKGKEYTPPDAPLRARKTRERCRAFVAHGGNGVSFAGVCQRAGGHRARDADVSDPRYR